MKKTVFAALLALATLATQAQTTWNLDASHSNVKFTVTHMIVSEMDGYFKAFDGKIVSNSPDFTNASIDFKVDVNSINTENEKRDQHLKGDDFFNAEKFPFMTFKSASFTKVSGNKYKLTGDLTIRDVTKRVTFDVTYGGTAKDPWGNTKAGFKATTTIKRMEYGLKWNTLTEAGGMVVSDEVAVTVNVEFNQAK
jgi:polyisoprenoid-binding protein YceI